MTPTLQRVLFVVLALLLLMIPALLRTTVWQYNQRDYDLDAVGALNRAATPVPTATPSPAQQVTNGEVAPLLRAGPVVVDLAHGNRLTRAAFEPLAAALAERGVGMNFWLSDVDLLALTSYNDFPDQADDLAPLLEEATALVVISPFFLWSAEELELVERFVARGGRLLLISDPDVLGDLAQDINNVAEPFGVVFHDDYLYNTVENDGNFVHVFQDQYLDRAAPLAGSQIALYGARSVGGEVESQVRTGQNVLSSLRSGVIQFDTVAVGGSEARGTAGRVLAMTDFDVLTQPYVARHDNMRLLEFTADFLAAGEMRDDVIDFPAFLGKEINLVFGPSADPEGTDRAVDAATLLNGARLQQRLEAEGRTLDLRGVGAFTRTLDVALGPVRADADEDATGVTAPDLASDATSQTGAETGDWLVLADYKLIAETPLLADLGFTLVEVTPTPAPDAEATPTSESDASLPDDARAEDVGADGEDIDEDGDGASNDGASDEDVNGEDADEESPDGDDPDAPESESGTGATVAVVGDLIQADATPEAPEEPAPDPSDPPPTVPEPADPEPTDPEPTDPIDPAVTPTPATVDEATADEDGVAPTATSTVTSTVTPTVASATATPEPEAAIYLVRDDGLRLLAAQTVLVAQRELPGGDRLVAVLGFDRAGISAGVERLLTRDYEGCITGNALAVCSYSEGRAAAAASTTAPSTELAADATATPAANDTDDPATPTAPTPAAPIPPPPNVPEGSILIVDDDANAVEGEESEADIYLQALFAQGFEPDLWSTASQDAPTTAQMLEYTWVIWSAAGYEGGGPTLNALDSLLGYINDGGRLTISSRRPFFGMSTADASAIVDVVVDDDIPAMITGLPSQAFNLVEGVPPVVPLEINARDEGPQVVLRRGPASGSPDTPLLFMVDDSTEEDSTGARLMILGMSLTWFTEGHERTLVANMAPVMLGD